VRPETCRGKKIAVIVGKTKNQCIKLEIKNKFKKKKLRLLRCSKMSSSV